MIRRILVIPGGGLCGVIPATLAKIIEATIREPLHQVFDLMAGTSTGSIICGALAAGVSAAEIASVYVEEGAKLFTPRSKWNPGNWMREKYDINRFIPALEKVIGDRKLSNAKTRYLSTAFNLCSERTHFIHSTDTDDGRYRIVDVISWSALNAAKYFGKICVPDFPWSDPCPDGTVTEHVGAVFQDGGQGTQNSPLGIALYEALINGWFENRVHVLFLGTGSNYRINPYSKMNDAGYITQILKYLEQQARGESQKLQQMMAMGLEKRFGGRLSVNYVDVRLPEKLNVLDGVKYIQDYKEAAYQIRGMIDFDALLNG